MPLELYGIYGSPYSMKMRALMRYRRVPFRFIPRGGARGPELPPVPVPVIPVLVVRKQGDGEDEAHVDSTPLIRRLEAMHPERSVIPTDAALAWLDALIEDYADEWLTKAMYCYRWSYPEDTQKAKHTLLLDTDPSMGAQYAELAEAFAERQIGRRGLVGINDATAPVIEQSYERLLARLSELLVDQPFVMGGRPGASDFGLFGQLYQLTWFDPTPSAIAANDAPRVTAWVHRADDLGWLDANEEAWIRRDQVATRLGPLLAEIGRTYVPFMRANAASLRDGSDSVEYEIDGVQCTQGPFKYQGKCLKVLRDAHGVLSDDDRAFLDPVLEEAGIAALL